MSSVADASHNTTINIAIAGVTGHMGRAALEALTVPESVNAPKLPAFKLSGAVSRRAAGQPLADLATLKASKTPDTQSLVIQDELKAVLAQTQTDVLLELTGPDTVFKHAMLAVEVGVRPLIGATGMTADEQAALDAALKARKLPGALIPNFSIGAVLMMQFAATASRYLDHAEIIEYHHTGKQDAPSGTALLTANRMIASKMIASKLNANPAAFNATSPRFETLNGCRGGVVPMRTNEISDNTSLAAAPQAGVPIHSVRLPGLVAHQEVIFGGLGQTLTIRHDSLNRQSFMPGVLLSARWLMRPETPAGLTIGLDAMLDAV
ncbi:MAG: dihydrodipicolinate reductase C-terminal domain-containing protein [Vampirovibrionales bacterium]|nr:dihydrodipicolinate reductase C-terminal domain-containing protein [Vampirovibrionales bacterium]